MLKTALIQLNSGDTPSENLPVTQDFIAEAAGDGAQFVLTPEVTNCVSASRAHQLEVLQTEAEDQTLAALRAQADALGIWLLIGSLALKTDDPDGRFANRSFLIGPDGGIVARYDKMHMFDVTVSQKETYRESKGYRPGETAVIAEVEGAKIGLSICYDIRFPYLYRALAQSGAQVLTAPSAFSTATGPAHWEPLLKARAIETGSFVLAPAQTGLHAATTGKARETYGHSLAISPWGEILCDGGKAPGISLISLDFSQVQAVRNSIPSLTHTRTFTGP
ncbi:carbon-nitrogen hydrolase family protein [Cognatishimia sp. MH4019]|uniref:carbon-nitrogen hydrolase family protein n=1 Tax=Cognatishimia sp. MH4019 TaxID=2854030 RepID=UPI001CD36461|nr:carbon-nitrogen hydrolase family protein [Cognatishimia sp. MH4019]